MTLQKDKRNEKFKSLQSSIDRMLSQVEVEEEAVHSMEEQQEPEPYIESFVANDPTIMALNNKKKFVVADLNTAEILLGKLKTFHTELFGFLESGYSDDFKDAAVKGVPSLKLVPENTKTFFSIPEHQYKYPKNFVFSQLRRQISTDYLLIKQKIESVEDPHLQIAEFLAERALAPSSAIELVPHGGDGLIVTAYPSDRVNVRVVPYTNAALIGFPMFATSSLEGKPYLSHSFLAIAHEVAHMVYRSGRIPFKFNNAQPLLSSHIQNRLREALGDTEQCCYADCNGNCNKQHWLFSWLEEIFADVYGLILEGPVYIAGFHEMMITDHPLDELGHSHGHDHEHPLPAIRPLMQSNILVQLVKNEFLDGLLAPDLVDQVGTLKGKLDDDWEKKLKETWPSWANTALNGKDLTEATYLVEGREISGEALLMDIENAVAIIIDTLIMVELPLKEISWIKKYAKNFEGVGEGKETEKLLQTYARIIKEEIGPGFLSGSIDSIKPLSGAGPLANIIEKRQPLQSVDEFVELLIFSGWSEEGPKTNGLGG